MYHYPNSNAQVPNKPVVFRSDIWRDLRLCAPCEENARHKKWLPTLCFDG